MAASTKRKVAHSNTMGGAKKKQKLGKRPDNPNEKAKHQKHEHFEAAHFKFMLRDKETTFEGFDKFIKAAESGKTHIIEEYVTSSLECKEIFEVLDRGLLKPTELALVFHCFEKILLHLTGSLELEDYFAVGKHIVTKLLTTYKRNIMFSLNIRNKSFHIKSTVKLITAMVMLGSLTATLVLTSITFTDANILPLLERRDVHDKEDVRTCLLHLIVAFLLSEDKQVTRKLFELKDFLEHAFLGLTYDRASSIELFLTTMFEKVVRSTSILKAVKTQVFTTKVLNSLGELFKWKGPVRRKDKITEQKEDLEAPSAKQAERVSELAAQFLQELCASYKHGVIFKDSTFGLSPRNNNKNVTSFLLTLTFNHKSPLATDLVVKSLSACPEQLPFYLPNLESKLEPQLNKTWMEYMALIYNVYQSIPHDPPVLRMKEPKSADQTVDMLLIYTCPSPKFTSTLTLGFKKKSLVINHILLKIIHILAERAVKVLSLINGEDKQDTPTWIWEEKTQIAALYRKDVIKALPEPKVLFDCLDVAQKKRGTEDYATLKEFTEETESEVDVRIIQTFCMYQELFPCIMVDNHLVLARLIDGILHHHTGDNYLPQVYLLKLLAGTDARRLPWAKQNKQGHSLMYQLLEMVSRLSTVDTVRDISLNLICKLLGKTGLFDGCEEELKVWIKPLQNQDSLSEGATPLISFVSSTLTSYMSNPYPYMDKMSDLMSEATILKSGGQGKSEMDDEDKFRAVVAMEIDNLDDEEEDSETSQSASSTTKRFTFCPMLLVALEMYTKQQGQLKGTSKDATSNEANLKTIPVNVTVVKSYLSVVIVDIFHQQVDPVMLCLQLQKCDPTDLLDGVLAYILTWLPTAESPKKKKKKLAISGDEILAVQRYGEMISKHSVFNQARTDTVDNVRQQLLYLTHVLGQSEFDENTAQKVNTLVKNIYNSIESVSSADTQEMETSAESEQLPILDNNSREQAPVSCVKTVLTHPKIMAYFLQERTSSQSDDVLTAVVKLITDFVIQLLEFISERDLTLEGPVLECFNVKVLTMLKTAGNLSNSQQQESLPSIHRYVKLMIHSMDTDRCLEVFNSLLTISTTVAKTDVCEVLDPLMAKLIASPVRYIQMKEENVINLITWFLDVFSETSDSERIGCLERFFQKYPALSVLCTEFLFVSVLNVKECGTLAVILLQNNSRLQTKFEDMLMSGEGVEAIQHELVIRDFLKLQCVRLSKENVMTSEVIGAVRDMFEPLFLQIAGPENNDDHCQSVFEVFQLLLKMEVLDKEHVVKMTKIVLKSLRRQNPSVLRVHHVKLVDTLFNCSLLEMDANINHALLHVCFECLTNTLSKARRRNSDLEIELLNILSRFEKEEMQNFPSTWDEFNNVWPVFVKKSLKHLYTNTNLLGFLTRFIPTVYDDSADVQIPLETVVDMVMSHSSFLPVMFNEESQECKGALVDLLLQLVELSPKSCKKDHVPILLAAYGGTLALTDQKVLKLIHFYESEGIDFFKFRPYLWGEKAIEFQTLHPNDKLTLRSMKMGKMLRLIDVQLMKDTILNFPLTRHLLNYGPVAAEKNRGISGSYDPCFFLSLFSFLLQPDKSVDCKVFINTECLGLVLSCLSSHDKPLRNAAYHVLDRFQLHLEVASFQGQEELLYLMKLLRNSLTEPVSKLAPLITVFLSRAVRLLFQPGDHMYGVIKSFLMARPTLEIFDIPDFYKLFSSSDVQHKQERAWILSLMQEGLREIADFRIFEKRYSFKLLFCFYDTETADIESQIKVLQIVKAGCKDRTMAAGLCNEHGVLAWIATAIARLTPEKKRHVTELVSILNSLWFTMLGKLETSKNKTGHLEPIFTSQMMSLLQNILWYLRDVNKEVLQTHLQTLMSVVKHLKLIVSMFRRDKQAVAPSNLTYVDLLILVVYVQRYRNMDFGVKSVLNILSSLGYDTGLLKNPRAEQSKKKEMEVVEETVEVEDSSKIENDVAQIDDDPVEENVIDNKKGKEKEKEEEKIDTDFVVVEEICKNVLTLILTENFFEAKSMKEELVAGSMVLTGWVVDRLENGRNSDMLLDGLKFVSRTWTDNHALSKVICAELGTGKNIIIGLLNMYSVIHSQHVQTYNECTRTLNSIVRRAVEKRFGKLGNFEDNVEDEALVLRQIFVTGEALATTVSQSKENRKRKGDGTDTEMVASKRNKNERKPLSKELTGVSQIVENMHLEGKPKTHEDEDDDDDDEEEEDVEDDDDSSSEEEVKDVSKDTNPLSNRKRKYFEKYQYVTYAKRDAKKARTRGLKSSRKSSGRKGK